MHGYNKNRIKEYIENQFAYNLSRRYEEIQPSYQFEISCQKSVPESLIAFLESTDYESAVRKSVAFGGDADTMAEDIDKDAAVSEGDELITSNISDKFLPGITIGYVTNLSLDTNNLTMSADVIPVVDFDHIQTVLVVLDLKQNIEEE